VADLAGVLADLAAESETVDAMVAGLAAASWALPTPAAGWTIAHQIGHLAWTDEIAHTAATEPGRFGQLVSDFGSAGVGLVDAAAAQRASLPPAELLDQWRAGRGRLAAALRALPAGAKLPWFGPPMGAMSMATARLMETWAHGVDIADALETRLVATSRLRHVAHLGVRTRDFAYQVNGRTPPAEPFRVELNGPSGEQWAWGPEDAAQRVIGPALDFCLLVTQRRHRSDLTVAARGADADEWLDIAQAFAGPPGAGRTPQSASEAAGARRS
jgi:uncharacterized protein (TIGR03084 family)